MHEMSVSLSTSDEQIFSDIILYSLIFMFTLSVNLSFLLLFFLPKQTLFISSKYHAIIIDNFIKLWKANDVFDALKF